MRQQRCAAVQLLFFNNLFVLINSGKARRGDGNDLTPNPRKLHNIGRELDNLNRLINDMTPVSELPMAVRPKSRKEKNKLASRFDLGLYFYLEFHSLLSLNIHVA